MSDLVKLARQRIDDTQRTHWEGCERDHRECLIQRMADEIERLRHELERERMRLAACGVVANANTKETAGEARSVHLDYQIDLLSAVIKAVDRGMHFRGLLRQVKEELK